MYKKTPPLHHYFPKSLLSNIVKVHFMESTNVENANVFKHKKSIVTNTVSFTNFTISDQQTPPHSIRYHSAESVKPPPKTEALPPVTVHTIQTGLLLMSPPAAAQPLPAGLCTM